MSDIRIVIASAHFLLRDDVGEPIISASYENIDATVDINALVALIDQQTASASGIDIPTLLNKLAASPAP